MSASLILLLKHLELALRLHAAVPTLELPRAYAHACAAQAAANEEVSPELLLAIAYIESRYDPTATSRVEDGERVLGRYPHRRRPPHLTPNSSIFCGPLQTHARTWSQCLHMRQLSVAYTTGARELAAWLADRRVHGNLRRALAGYACGNHGVLTGHCNAYPQRVLSMERKIEGAQRTRREVEARRSARARHAPES
jgi:hypothetical protein